MANILFLELYHGAGTDHLDVEAAYVREQQIYAAADWVFVHHELLAGFFRRHVFDHPTDRTFEMKLSGPSRQFEIATAALLTREDIYGVHLD